MEKKVTVKDVAREASVSVATVSYIMNDRKDQKISEETRKKVLQIANLLNYRPSHAAKTLATGKTNLIGLSYVLRADAPSRNMEINLLVNHFIERLNRMNYNVILINPSESEGTLPMKGMIDGIIAIDLPDEQFRFMADHYLVPIISVDMNVNDPLFYQIYTDYPGRIAEAKALLGSDALLLMDEFSNETIQTAIAQSVPESQIIYYKHMDGALLQTLKGRKAIILGNYLGLLLQPYMNTSDMCIITSEDHSMMLPHGAHSIQLDTAKKANLCISILMNAIDRKFDVAHDYPL